MTIIVSRQSTIIKEVKSVSNPLNSLKQPYSGMKNIYGHHPDGGRRK